MAKTYEEIKAKYAKDVTTHKNKVALATNKVERVEALLEQATTEREKYRTKNGVITSENATMWNRCSTRITELKKQLEAAKSELATVEAGERNINKLNENLGL